MTAQEAGGIVGIIVALTGAYIAWRKYRPETNDITVTTADKVNTMTLRFANDVSKDNDDLRAEIDELRKEFRQYRDDTDAEMAQLKVEVRAERNEKERYMRENDDLRNRVGELENEVRALKSGRR
jgi:predicted RNase H-like nuclease (RuvC/YqgF family)